MKNTESIEPSDAERESAPPRPALPFPVVGIGGSAGALGALRTFFENAPAKTGMAFVIVMHLSPEHGSELDAILQRSTRMPVQQVTGTVAIEVDHVYVIAPGHQLSMSDGHLIINKVARQSGPPVAVDMFFRSLAEAHREHALCVVLSGTGSDGSVGIKHMRELGGVTIAQSPSDAEFDDMPVNAIATGVVDFVLPVADIPQKLIDIWGNAQRIELPPIPGGPTPARAIESPEATAGAQEAVRQILAGLLEHTRNDFSHYKPGTVLRRLERRMQVHRVPTLQAYQAVVQAQPAEYDALLQDLLISVTSFFRDREAFEALERQLEQSFAEHLHSGRPLRAWVAGCATGEEAYSVAMLLWEFLAAKNATQRAQVFASDIDERAISIARAGRYPEAILADLPPTRLRQFFVAESGRYQVRKDLREAVLFSVHNLLRDPPFSKLDLLCCRNLLIYLDREVQQRILQTFHFALRPGGLLFLGSAESTEAAPELFEIVDRKQRIFRSRSTAALPGPRPPMAFTAVPARDMAEKAIAAHSQVQSDRARLHERLLAHEAQASLLVDARGLVLHLSDRASKFLRHVGGAPSHSLLALIRREIRVELRTALTLARKRNCSVDSRQVDVEFPGMVKRVRVVVTPCTLPEAASLGLMLVRFVETDASLAPDEPSPGGRDPMLDELEQELQTTRERLQGSLGLAETSGEELRAANEELQAIIEELRSATEELETSKEELQSVNEELISLNDELKARAEDAAAASNDLSNLLSSADIATIFVDGAMRIKRYTPLATNVFNLLPTDVGRPLSNITHQLDYDALLTDAKEVFHSLRSVEREVAGSGGKRFLVRVVPYRTDEDRIEGAVLTFIDISALRQTEESLHLGELQMQAVAESATDFAIITLDPQGRVTHWSRGAEQLFGYREAEMTGQLLDAIFVPEDRAAGAPAAEVRCAREAGRSLDERWHLHKDGTRLYCSGTMRPLSEGGMHGYVKIARELTATKLAEEERERLLASEKQLRAELERASTLKDEFLAVMSHELKHPLNLIHINAELLTRLPAVKDNAEVARPANVIRRTVFSQAKIIDDLLDLSRLNTGKLQLNLGPVDWPALIQRIIPAVQADAQAKELVVGVAIEPRAVMIWADWVRVEQIVWNLLSNAVKFTRAGDAVDVRLSVEGDMARLDVADTGRGIEPHLLPHVFEMFRQAGDDKARREGGLGIGLSMVRHLSELHGGRVEARSDGPGKGACISVWLPLLSAAGAAGVEQAPAALSGMRILLVDDAEDTLESFAMLLRLEGAEVVTARSGPDALAALDNPSPRLDLDLVISDVRMPGMEGYEFLALLREREAARSLPVIALTSLSGGASTARLLACGFIAHLTKPLEIHRLLQAIDEMQLRPGQKAHRAI